MTPGCLTMNCAGLRQARRSGTSTGPGKLSGGESYFCRIIRSFLAAGWGGVDDFLRATCKRFWVGPFAHGSRLPDPHPPLTHHRDHPDFIEKDNGVQEDSWNG